MYYTPFICLSVCLSITPLLNVPTDHCAEVLFNWWQAGAAVQQACCISLCTFLGRATVVSVVNQADTTHTCFDWYSTDSH